MECGISLFLIVVSSFKNMLVLLKKRLGTIPTSCWGTWKWLWLDAPFCIMWFWIFASQSLFFQVTFSYFTGFMSPWSILTSLLQLLLTHLFPYRFSWVHHPALPLPETHSLYISPGLWIQVNAFPILPSSAISLGFITLLDLCQVHVMLWHARRWPPEWSCNQRLLFPLIFKLGYVYFIVSKNLGSNLKDFACSYQRPAG